MNICNVANVKNNFSITVTKRFKDSSWVVAFSCISFGIHDLISLMIALEENKLALISVRYETEIWQKFILRNILKLGIFYNKRSATHLLAYS